MEDYWSLENYDLGGLLGPLRLAIGCWPLSTSVAEGENKAAY